MWCALVVLAGGQGAGTPASACYPPVFTTPVVSSYPRVCPGPNCFDAFTFGGHPAVSSRSSALAFEGVSLAAESRLAIDNGYFRGAVSGSGYTEIFPFSSFGVSAHVEGSIYECLTGVRELKQLQDENTRLKKLVAELSFAQRGEGRAS
jgi:hypothetical protein